MQIGFHSNCNRTNFQTVQAKPPNKAENFHKFSTPPSACAGQSSHQLLLWLLGLCIPMRRRSANFTSKIANTRPTSSSEYASSRIQSDNSRTEATSSVTASEGKTGQVLSSKSRKNRKTRHPMLCLSGPSGLTVRSTKSGVKGHKSRERGV